jgi:DnaJ-class molecular chaperone
MGIHKLDESGKGDQVVHLKVIIPKDVTPRQIELLLEFEREIEKGFGFSKKLGKVAESAFERMFGSKTSSTKNNASDGIGTSQEDHSASKLDEPDEEPKRVAN